MDKYNRINFIVDFSSTAIIWLIVCMEYSVSVDYHYYQKNYKVFSINWMAKIHIFHVNSPDSGRNEVYVAP